MRPTARETARVDVPTSQPSCVAFGGAQFDTLYVTSARIGLDEQALQVTSGAGGVFVATPAARGVAEPVFARRKRQKKNPRRRAMNDAPPVR